MVNPRVAFSSDFMESYSRLPRQTQRKVREFTEKFQRDPSQASINFERINEAKDDKVRSARIDQAYRVIVVQPPRGDVYLCAWVDHHDEAYRWVRNKRFEVNPTSGSFQLFEELDAVRASPAAASSVSQSGGVATRLFDGHADEDLLLAGVPLVLLPAVRALLTEDELDQVAPHLPADASEMLYLLAAGYSLLDAIEEADRAKHPKASVDVDDFAGAMARPEAQRSFRVLENEKDLEAILNAPLEQWRVFLHPTQRKLVEMRASGPVRVLGSAGTGKTVVLMHRARYLASRVFTGESDRILVTTFTRNLAFDLQANLKNLCGEEFQRLEVTNLHRWASQFMKRQGFAQKVAPESRQRDLFDSAVSDAGLDDFSAEFLRDEWDRVIQPQDIDARDAYFTARRVGRGTRLNRRQRSSIWAVFQRYRELLDEAGLVEWPDVIREARLFIEKRGTPMPYKAVLADEVQDFSPNELKLLRILAPEAPDSLFLVGDGHQRIYGQATRLSWSGIETRGRSKRLRLNYRTTEQIRNQAVAVLEGVEVDDLDGLSDTLSGYRSLRFGPTPAFMHFDKESDEAAFVVSQIQTWRNEGVPEAAICIAARTAGQLDDRYSSVLSQAGVTFTVLKGDEVDPAASGIRMATMHRMKGLEFSRVLLVGVQEGKVPLNVGPHPDEASEADHERQERCLLYVAMTRARDELTVTGFGTRSSLLNRGDGGGR